LHKEIGIAGNLLAEEARIKPHPEVMIIAGLKADDHADGFAFVKIGLSEERLRTEWAEHPHDDEHCAQQ
jgi:hypothetical protein